MEKKIKKIIAVFMSVMLVIVLMPHSVQAATPIRNLGLFVHLYDFNDFDLLGNFYAINISDGQKYELKPSDTIEEGEGWIRRRYEAYIPEGRYNIVTGNDEINCEFAVYFIDYPYGLTHYLHICTINYYDGEELIETQYVSNLNFPKLPEAPVKEGYVFNRWNNEDGTQYVQQFHLKSHNIYASWREVPKYDAVVDVTINGQKPTEDIENIANELGEFYLMDVNDSNKVYPLEFNNEMTYSTELYNGEYKVLWNNEALEYYVENIVINDADDIVEVDFNTVHYMYGEQELEMVYVENNTTTEAMAAIPQAQDSEYEFLGWFCEPELKNLFDFSEKITKETFLYAGFEEISEPETTEPETTEPETTEPETTEPETTEPETTEPETTEPETTEPETTEPETTEPETTEPETTEPETTEPETTEPETTELETTEPETTEPETTEPETTEPETTEPETTEPETTEPETTEPETTEPETMEPETMEPETMEPETVEKSEELPTPPVDEETEERPTPPVDEETEELPTPPADEESEELPPPTGDSTQVVIYATLGMIAGATYLLAYFYNNLSMSEEQKKELVFKIIQWAKDKNIVVKGFAIVFITIILVYYHAIGKKIDMDTSQINELTSRG